MSGRPRGGSLNRPVAVMLALVLALAIGVATEIWRRSRPDGGGPPSTATPQPRLRVPAADLLRGAAPAPAPSPIRLTDVTGASRISFTYYGSPSPEHYMTEQNGGGTAIADFDGDGVPDVFLVNGSHFDRGAEAAGASQKLYRGMGELTFRDATRSAGLAAFGFGMGCVAADYDNDGFADLLVTGYGRNRLWRNLGDGTFAEAVLDGTARPTQWSTSAAFADFDGDGDLDLYIVNYVDWKPDDPPCFTQHQPPVQISCGPLGRTGQSDRLYRNNGDGTFQDVSAASGIGEMAGKGLGVSVADFDEDGRLDIYVANDTTENLLWRNLGGLRFENVALVWGAALGTDGVARSGMGVACADYNRDGAFDLFVTNFEGEPNSLFQNVRPAGFVSRNTECGLNAVSRPLLGFGTVFADFEGDGYPDLFVANGHVWDLTPLGLGYSYAMPPNLFRNEAGQRFRDVSRTSGSYFREKWIGRGTACSDLDGDGDPDLVITHLMRPAAVLRNDSEAAGPRASVRFVGTESARQPLGARVECTIGDARFTLRIASGDGFQSASEDRVLLPAHASGGIESMRIFWADGTAETWHDLPGSSRLTLREGTGARKKAPAL